ncbi:MAG: DUF1559 domain-containing protein [Planctomycetaceae bacterium]
MTRPAWNDDAQSAFRAPIMNEVSAAADGKSSRTKRIGCLVVLVAFVGTGAFLTRAIRDAREAARTSQCGGRMGGQLRLALHNYHETYGCFPPAYIADAEGNPMHSWRVLILPFMDQQKTYAKYRFDEPWDSSSQPVTRQRPIQRHLHCPSDLEPEHTLFANYVVIVGPETAFPGTRCTSLADIVDPNSILLVETVNSGIHWTEPRDLNVNDMSFSINDLMRPSVSSNHPRGPMVVLSDPERARRLSLAVRPETLRAMTTIAGGEQLSPVISTLQRAQTKVTVSLGFTWTHWNPPGPSATK